MQVAPPSAPLAPFTPPVTSGVPLAAGTGVGAVSLASSASPSLSVAPGTAADAGAAPGDSPLPPGPLDILHTAVAEAHDRIDSLATISGVQTGKLTQLDARLGAVQSTLAELDTPADNAALEVILTSVAKPGIHTTEFWLHLLFAVGTLCLAAAHIVSGNTAACWTFAGTGLYTLSRLCLKGHAADIANKTIK